MRTLTLIVMILALGCDANSGAVKPTAQPVAKVLDIGDPAPPLTVAKWLHGTPVALQPGTAYVIDFWAIWCGPCKQAMPHLDALAREFGPQGVECVAVTHDDGNNDLAAVERYVEETGRRFDIHYAWCEDDAMQTAWMIAAHRSGIPCSFVVDKAGKIAFIG